MIKYVKDDEEMIIIYPNGNISYINSKDKMETMLFLLQEYDKLEGEEKEELAETITNLDCDLPD